VLTPVSPVITVIGSATLRGQLSVPSTGLIAIFSVRLCDLQTAGIVGPPILATKMQEWGRRTRPVQRALRFRQHDQVL
jgi:hypothetical protein